MIQNFIVAPDSFKDSLTASEAADAIKQGIIRVNSNANVELVPMADGGEGTLDALVNATNGGKIKVVVNGPLPNQKVNAELGLIDNGKTAVVEMAKASGLELVPTEERNPMITSTFGVGELISAALDKGVKKIIVGVGGSATNDGGMGMACALGTEFLDENNQPLDPKGQNLSKICKINNEYLDKRLKDVTTVIASDVDNPLNGKNGATNVFAAQKGASQNDKKELNTGMENYAEVIQEKLGIDINKMPGGGAAGGLATGLVAFADATIQSGVKTVADAVQLEDKIKQTDVVFTGEGKIDLQTKFGKTPFGVAQIAQKYQKPVIAEAGSVGNGIGQLYQYGFTAIFGIVNEACPLPKALKKAGSNLERTTENVVRLLKK